MIQWIPTGYLEYASRMSIRAGVGFANFPFKSAKAYLDFARFCDVSGIDSIWQTDRLQSEEPFLEAMSALAVVAGTTQKIKSITRYNLYPKSCNSILYTRVFQP